MTEIKKTTTKKVGIKKEKKSIPLDATIYSQKGTSTGTIALPTKIFGLTWNADLVHQVVVAMMANKRAGTAHTKDRSEVSGGGKKPWKQKGTGQARHGSNRSPIWSGGGITFGPRNDKDYSQKINKKTRVKALFTVLSRKYADGAILFVETIALPTMKTKDAQRILSSFATIPSFEKIYSTKRTGALMILPEMTDTIEKSFANLPGITVMKGADLNALVLMNFRYIVMVNPVTLVENFEAKMK